MCKVQIAPNWQIPKRLELLKNAADGLKTCEFFDERTYNSIIGAIEEAESVLKGCQ